MSFLAPLFLFGALAVGAPIVFHLIRRHTKDIVPFSSLMFLQPSPPRIHRRSRLENLWLLLLRCIALILLAFGFARPFLQRKDSNTDKTAAVTRRVVLLDTSASMRRSELWPQARAKLSELAHQASAADELAVVAFDRTSRTLVSFEDWRRTAAGERKTLCEQRVAGISPGFAGTALGPALLQAAELLESVTPSPGTKREIVLISDLQEGSRLDGLQGYVWPAGVRLRLETLEIPEQANAAAAWVTGSTEGEPRSQAENLLLRVTSSAGNPKDQFQLHRRATDGSDAGSSPAYVPAGQTRIVRLPKFDQPEGQQIELTGDEVSFDNTLFVVPAPKHPLPVVFVGNEAANAPEQSVFYLQRALATMQQNQVEFRLRRADAPLAAADLQGVQLLALGEGVTAATVEAAHQFAEAGHVVLFPLTSESSGNVLPPLLGAAVPLTEAGPRGYALLAQIEFQHPFFAPFADPRFSDFTKIHFWKYRHMDLRNLSSARVLARFDSGDPALVQLPVGKGSIVVLASSWRPADSQLALSSKFVPLLGAILEQSNRLPAIHSQYFVGDEVPLATESGVVTVRKPNGEETQVADGRFTGTDQPGIYSVQPLGTRFAVNLNPEESRLAPMPHDRLATLGLPLETAGGEAAADASAAGSPITQAAELESRQKLWRWLLAAAFVVLLFETWLAGRLARPVSSQPLPS